MIIVTGGAGFIGSCIVAQFNARANRDIVIVDHLVEGDPKQANLKGLKYETFFDKNEFLSLILSGKIQKKMPGAVDLVIHMGACSSTTLSDARYYRENNFEYSCHLARWSLDIGARFIYASSAATYGDGSRGYDDAHDKIRGLKPLNLYGESKQNFDVWVLEQGLVNQVVGLKFFNVFGPNEQHKGDMRSVVAKAFPKVAEQGRMALFKSYLAEYGDGEQKRDFIYIKDALKMVDHIVAQPSVSGIYNIGTGKARSWNDLAHALFAAIGKKPQIDYIDMPENLREKYQYFTEAKMEKFYQSGFRGSVSTLEDSIQDYVGNYLSENRHFH